MAFRVLRRMISIGGGGAVGGVKKALVSSGSSSVMSSGSSSVMNSGMNSTGSTSANYSTGSNPPPSPSNSHSNPPPSQSNSQSNSQSDSPRRPLYMDFQATTPTDPRVLSKMKPFWEEEFGNPHSRTHAYGWASERAVEAARTQVANLIGAQPKDIVFTSGATESCNLALKGVARFYAKSSVQTEQGGKTPQPPKMHIITAQTEHKCILDSCRALQQEGFQVTYLPVLPNGLVDLKALREAITPQTLLVSIMAVNNEIGVIQPLAEIGTICREAGVFFHTDAAQAVGKIPIDVEAAKIDLLSISGHKIYGPKGIGALYVRRKGPKVRIEPLLTGGGQERGLRAGTLPTPLVVGLGEACEIAGKEMSQAHERISMLSRRLLQGICGQLERVERNGATEHCWPGCVNLSFVGVEGESLLMALKAIALSSGSACTSASLEPSYVLRALGKGEEQAHSSIRFGIGKWTTEEDVDFAIEQTVAHVKRLRQMSPLWEMLQEGIDLGKVEWK